MAKIWHFYGQTIVFSWSFKLVLPESQSMCPEMFDPNFTLLDVSYSRISKKWPKYCPFLAKIWSSHCPSNWFFLNLNQFAQECSMLNFTLLGLSCCPFFLETAKICPFYGKTWSSHGPSNWLFLNPNWCDQGCSMPNFTLLGVTYSSLSWK